MEQDSCRHSCIVGYMAGVPGFEIVNDRTVLHGNSYSNHIANAVFDLRIDPLHHTRVHRAHVCSYRPCATTAHAVSRPRAKNDAVCRVQKNSAASPQCIPYSFGQIRFDKSVKTIKSRKLEIFQHHASRELRSLERFAIDVDRLRIQEIVE